MILPVWFDHIEESSYKEVQFKTFFPSFEINVATKNYYHKLQSQVLNKSSCHIYFSCPSTENINVNETPEFCQSSFVHFALYTTRRRHVHVWKRARSSPIFGLL